MVAVQSAAAREGDGGAVVASAAVGRLRHASANSWPVGDSLTEREREKSVRRRGRVPSEGVRHKGVVCGEVEKRGEGAGCSGPLVFEGGLSAATAAAWLSSSASPRPLQRRVPIQPPRFNCRRCSRPISLHPIPVSLGHMRSSANPETHGLDAETLAFYIYRCALD